ncbi:MAG: PD-(D/E)XK nuclease family protein [Vitreoscilla sp.]|nr:PD-(D/E)XK nuclease family protein [Vitreoscilla sp.]
MPAPPPSITICHLARGRSDAAWWAAVVAEIHAWAAPRQLDLRDAIWLLPYSALLAPARRALALRGGWQPRVETIATLLAQCGPRAAAQPGVDPVIDRLQAAQWLLDHASGVDWGGAGPRAFAQAAESLARTAGEFRLAASAQAPPLRDAWWQRARSLLAQGTGPGAVERALARVALEWAASTGAGEIDPLLALKPAAWIVLRAGGADPLADAVMSQGTVGLLLDADPPAEAPFSAVVELDPPAEVRCADAEAEAQAACAQILADLQAHADGTVALVAQDREAVRRIRALLERFGVAAVDDTGWRLSTTRAAARLMGLLRAARHGATQDDRLNWLKDDPLGSEHTAALAALESRWRGERVSDTVAEQADALWRAAQARLAPLTGDRRLPLSIWCERVAQLCLADEREAARWRDDAAGRAVLATLRCEPPHSQATHWQALARRAQMTLAEYTDWVDETLADASFVPPHAAEARVVITPLARAMLRPFAAVVFPGTDERSLGAGEPAPDLLGPAVAAALGLPDPAARRQRETLALAQVLRLPHVTLLRRTAEGSEPLGASPLLERFRAALPPGRDLRPHHPCLPNRTAPRQPVTPPAARATGRWPESLSASAVEALRACPYRFFSRVMLGLSEPEELDLPPDKRDYGTWLHAVLMRFHSGRGESPTLDEDRARFSACAWAQSAETGTPEGELLPFLASFEALVEPYLAWWRGRESAGWRWWQGEQDKRIEPPALGGLALKGRLDRLDRDGAGRIELLDYKTVSVDKLKRTVADRFEDTQLAFYAALVLGAPDAPPPADLTAAYLAMDDKAAPLPLRHPDVAVSAEALVANLAIELQRVRGGEPLRALGESDTCEHCEARGLCRRDHWSAPEEPR